MTTIPITNLTCRICGKPIELEQGGGIPEGDLHSWSHAPCYVEEYRHTRGLDCGNKLCTQPQCGDVRDHSAVRP